MNGGVQYPKTFAARRRPPDHGQGVLRYQALDEIASALGNLEIDLVAGGPPCQPFSKAGENKIRSLVRSGTRPDLDERRELWQVFMDFVERVSPKAMLMENVPEIALGRNSQLFRAILARMERLGYSVHCRVLRAWQFGVPQHRSR
ncbi:MAG: DNA cytosine methyltransferase, partial [Chloroflexi bacterium]|nr:DNA cytosine methyltransferase [Chloroflexota bacterium]